MTTPALHEFVPFLVAKGHVCAFCLCALPLCSHERGDKAVHYQVRDRRRPKAAWYRTDRGCGGGWSFAHLFASIVGPAVQSACGYQPGLAVQRVLFAPALPEDPRCKRCERLEAS